MEFEKELLKFSTQGYLEFENVIDLDLLNNLNLKLEEMRKKHGVGSMHLIDKKTTELIKPIIESERFKKVEVICRMITVHQSQGKYLYSESDQEHQVIRCADVHSANISNGRHYDSYLQTILIPIQMAFPAEASGDLILYKKTRNTYSSGKNMVEKILAKYTFSNFKKREQRSFADLNAGLAYRVNCKLGNLYFFNGFKTKHCNLSVSSGERRSLLLHSYNPTLDFNIGKVLRTLRRF